MRYNTRRKNRREKQNKREKKSKKVRRKNDNKKRFTKKAKGFIARDYTNKSILLKKINIVDDIRSELLKDLKMDTAATMIQNTYKNRGKKNLILRELVEYELKHDRENMSIHFNVFDPELANLLEKAALTNYVRSDIKGETKSRWINLLGRIYFGLNEEQYGGPPGSAVYYNRIENAFIKLVKKILNINVNREHYLQDDRLFEILIEPLIR